MRKRGREEWGEDKYRKEKEGTRRRNSPTSAKGDVYKELRAERKAGGEIQEGHTGEHQALQLKWYISYIYTLFYILL